MGSRRHGNYGKATHPHPNSLHQDRWGYARIALAALAIAVSLTVGAACSTDTTEPAQVQPTPAPDDEFAVRRFAMVAAYADDDDITDSRVLKAMSTVRREEFVLPRDRERAYLERALAINAGQTISQPYIVALMTDLLELEPGDRVLEIGTGSGYQGAVLAEITDHVYSIEIIPSLATEVAAKLERLGYGDINLRLGDGYFGWEEEAPFDGIIVTAAPRPRAPTPAPAARRRRQDGHPGRPAGRSPDPMASRAQGRRVHQAQPGRGQVRPLHQGAPLGLRISSTRRGSTHQSLLLGMPHRLSNQRKRHYDTDPVS